MSARPPETRIDAVYGDLPPRPAGLAKVGYERIQDMSDPARSLDRMSEAELILTALAELSSRHFPRLARISLASTRFFSSRH